MGIFGAGWGREAGEEASRLGPLRVHPENPRYFTVDGKSAVYVTGAHTWANLQDQGVTDPPPAFDFAAYLDFLTAHGHNFIRLWRWEVPKWNYGQARRGQMSFCEPHPWQRPGPGTAADGKPRFDLTRFNEGYFHRLRERVVAAATRGIYVSVMLFEGHCLQIAEQSWVFHPFHPQNNVNGVQLEWADYYGLKNADCRRFQEAYVRKVIETVGDLDNVLYEICNEAGGYSTQWQYHLIRFIKDVERERGRSHPVGMTFQYRGGSNAVLFDSAADWISPNPEGGYREDPPANDGRKVVLSDTDHLWGEGGNPPWVWKTFCRGHHPLFMDRIAALTKRVVTWAGRQPEEDIPGAEQIRKAMGVTLRVAQKLDLARMLPLPQLASSGYCLSEPGRQYVVYVPEGAQVEVDLRAGQGRLQCRWVHPIDGSMTEAPPVAAGSWQKFEVPPDGKRVLLLQAG